MNAYERQAIREKHFSDFCDCHDEHAPFKCVGCSRLGATVVWPCEVIQVLDAIENHLISCDTEQAEIRNKCDHLLGTVHDYWVEVSDTKDDKSWLTNDFFVGFTYCPKCGEKL